MQEAQPVNKQWFMDKLEEKRLSLRGLARHLKLDASAVSRTLSGQRKMQMDEAHSIALFLHAPVAEVMRHAGVAKDLDGMPTRILLAATINTAGEVERMKDAKPLPQAVIDRASSAIIGSGNSKIIAAQIRADGGPFAIWDDAVVLFNHTEIVENAAIGALSICRTRDGNQFLAKIERARKTGEARIHCSNGKMKEVILDTATPVLAIIP